MLSRLGPVCPGWCSWRRKSVHSRPSPTPQPGQSSWRNRHTFLRRVHVAEERRPDPAYRSWIHSKSEEFHFICVWLHHKHSFWSCWRSHRLSKEEIKKYSVNLVKLDTHLHAIKSNIIPAFETIFQVRQQELAVEGVDGRNVGEDIFYHLWWERASICFLHQPRAKHLEWQSGISHHVLHKENVQVTALTWSRRWSRAT